MNLRENIKKELRLLNEQQPTHYRWKGYGPYNPNSQFNCFPSSTVEWQINGDGEDFYLAVGSPNQGEFAGMPQNNAGLGAYGCWEYLGTTSTPPSQWVYGQNNSYIYMDAVAEGLQTSQAQTDGTDCQSCYCSSGNPNAHGSCTPSCDTSTSSPCAVQWWQNPNATWAATWINNRDCSNYTWPANNLETQALAIMAAAPSPQPNIYSNATDIWAAANASGLVNPQKGQFIGKMAKSKFSQCQKSRL